MTTLRGAPRTVRGAPFRAAEKPFTLRGERAGALRLRPPDSRMPPAFAAGRQRGRARVASLNRNRGILLGILVALIMSGAGRVGAAPEPQAATQPAHRLLRCTNPASGARFSLPVDLRERIADSFPARVTERMIAWHDTTHGGYYSFNRVNGRLTVVFPSSTGGFSLYDNCVLQH